MARMVYANVKQFDNFEDLIESIVNVSRSLTAEYMQRLFRSISRCLLVEMDKREIATKYKKNKESLF